MNKKSVITGTTSLLLLAMLFAVFVAPAAAKALVPFKGSIQAVETNQFDFPNMLMYVDATGSGESSHLGRFLVSYEVVVNLINGMGDASLQFVAADGSSLSALGTGLGVPSATPDVNYVVEQYTIVGGTGRFAGATGSFTVERWVNKITGVSSGSFSGAIDLP